METIIIMTEVVSPYGKYVKFTKKGSLEILAEVDKKRMSEFGWDGYVVYGRTQSEIGRRTNKLSAVKVAQDYIKGFMPEAEFKWNVMQYKYKYA